MELTALVTTIALLEYMFFTLRVGMARGQFGVDAPATTGHPEFERYYRVQENTLEQLIVFLPSLWLFSQFWGSTIGAGVGALFLIGRPLYFAGYVKAPEKRTTGFLLGFLSNVILLIGALVGAIRAMLG